MLAKLSRTSIHLGFSLLEMAVVLAIVGLLLAGLLPSISSQLEQQRRSATRQQLDEIKEALYGYSIINKHLPCPASQVSGMEDRNLSSAACNQRVGFLPAASLGLNGFDAWGRAFRYSATPVFTDASSVFAIGSSADISIRNLDGSALSNASAIPAVIISPGANGLFGTQANGVTLGNSASLSEFNVARQQANVSGLSGAGVVFFSADHTARSSPADEEFDDLLVWISPAILINRMVSAGKLP